MLRLLWTRILFVVIAQPLLANQECSDTLSSKVRVIEANVARVTLRPGQDDTIELRVPNARGELWKIRAQVVAKYVFAPKWDEMAMSEELLLVELRARGLNAESVQEMNQLASSMVPGFGITHDQLWQQLTQQTRMLRSQRR
jgi:hypothetical protein